MTKIEEIRKLERDLDLVKNIRRDLLLDGFDPDSDGVQYMDNRIRVLEFKLYLLKEKDIKRMAGILQRIRIHLN